MHSRLEACSVVNSGSIILIEDYGKKLYISNPQKEEYRIIKVDGCVIKRGKRADFVVSRRGIGDVVIEFRGRDFNRACEQIRMTIEFWNKHSLREGRLSAVIVSCRCPSMDTVVQKKRKEMQSRFSINLKVMTSKKTTTFEAAVR